jgi:hypothetical protein
MLDIIQAPTPYIIGILRSCEHYLSDNSDFLHQDHSDIVLIDIDHDRIRSSIDYDRLLPKVFKLAIKHELSYLKKTQANLSHDECQQRLRQLFMSLFVQSCYNYRDYFHDIFHSDTFLQSKTSTMKRFLEWFIQTQIFQLFIRDKHSTLCKQSICVTFDLACDTYRRITIQPVIQRTTVKSIKRKAATRASKQVHP